MNRHRVDVSRNPKLSKRFGVSEATGLPEIVFLKTTDYKEWSDGDVIKKARVDETRYGRSSTSVDQLRQFLKGMYSSVPNKRSAPNKNSAFII